MFYKGEFSAFEKKTNIEFSSIENVTTIISL